MMAKIERPAYWDECKKMDFGRLRQFIDDSLQEPPTVGLDDRPRSKEDFLALLEMLCGKIDASGLPVILPALDKPPVFPQFEPSEQLKSLLDQREKLKVTLEMVRRHRSVETNWIIVQRRRKLRLLEGDINLLESRERQNYEKRRDAHLRPYQEAQRQRQRWPQRWQIIERMSRDIERVFKFGAIVPTSRLSWRVLPPGELSVSNVLEHYGRLQRLNPHISYERDRITKAFSLRPNQCYVGSDEFEGYIVLTFAHTSRTLLECPVFGNAIYILDSEWKRLSKMTKQELLTHPSANRIIHRGDWFWRVKQELRIR